MQTNADYFKSALQKIGVLAEGESVSAEQGADMLTIFNDMMDGLLGEGVDLGFAAQTSTTDEPDIQEGYKEAIKCMLAMKAAPHFDIAIDSISAEVVRTAQQGYNRMLREAIYREAEPKDYDHLPVGRRGSNILTGP